MNKTIISNHEHPLYNDIQYMDGFLDYENAKPIKEGILFDLTLLNDEKKSDFLSQHSCSIYSDLSVNNGEVISSANENIKGSMATAFRSPMNKCEYHGDEKLLNFLSSLELTGVHVKSPGFGFTYPRIISMIINEAFFALEDNLAERKDIDTAMKYGVNYPMGPFEWYESIGPRPVIMLLEELFSNTGDRRYEICQKLKEELK